MNETLVTVLGHVGTPPRSAVTKSGHPVTSFRLASTPRRFDRRQGSWTDGPTSWFTVSCWRLLAEHVTSCVAMGQPVIVHGRLSAKQYTRGDGTTGISLEIDAITIGHDLARGTAMFERRDHEPSDRATETDTTAEDLARLVTEEAEQIAAAGARAEAAGDSESRSTAA